jgi:hypothetical protein
MNRKYSIKSIIAAGLLSALICTVVQLCRDEANSTVKATESARFELIDSCNSDTFRIYVDNDTGVQYLAYKLGKFGAGIVVMVDSEGKPLMKGEGNETD